MTDEETRYLAVHERNKRWWIAAIVVLFLSLIVLALTGLSASLYYQNRDQGKKIAVLLAKRQAEDSAKKRATDVAKVATCYATRKNAPNTRVLLDVLETSALNTRQAAQEALSSNPNDELTQTRERTLKRMERALAVIRQFRQKFERELPSLAECKKLAKKYHVNPKDLKDET